jgi:hypothetical protein
MPVAIEEDEDGEDVAEEEGGEGEEKGEEGEGDEEEQREGEGEGEGTVAAVGRELAVAPAAEVAAQAGISPTLQVHAWVAYHETCTSIGVHLRR